MMQIKHLAAADSRLNDLASVREHFESWRKERKRQRDRIPDQLWKEAESLAQNHSINQISKALKLNYTDLKNRIQKAAGYSPKSDSDSAPDFIEVPFPGHCKEYMLEIHKNDACMKVHAKGIGLDLASQIAAFWRGV